MMKKKSAEPKLRDVGNELGLSIEEFISIKLDPLIGKLSPYTYSLYDFVIEQVERPLIKLVLRHTGGNQSKASRILGINRGTLKKMMDKYGLSNKKTRKP